MAIDKQTIRALITQLISKALVSVVKIVKTKLLPKAMERYCKNLQKGVDKLVSKTNELIDKIPTIKDTKRLIGTLYVLKLMKETASTLSQALKLLVESIEANVDFSPIEEPENDEIASAVRELDVLANAVSGDDFGSNCNENGCEIV